MAAGRLCHRLSAREWTRAGGARDEAKQLLSGCLGYLQGDGLGQLCELFDGDKPHRPGGAIASASSVAELLRAYSEDVLDRLPVLPPKKVFNSDPAKVV